MPVTIVNRTLSPYDLPTSDGFVRLPALGEVEGEFGGEYLEILKASMAVEVIEAPKAKPKPAKTPAPAAPPAAAPVATPEPKATGK